MSTGGMGGVLLVSKPTLMQDLSLPQLLFDMQDLVDAIAIEPRDVSGGTPSKARAPASPRVGKTRLKDLCYKPMGDVCATESFLQYWQMSRKAYRSGTNPPSLCLDKWTSQCLSAYGAPVDPRIGELTKWNGTGNACACVLLSHRSCLSPVRSCRLHVRQPYLGLLAIGCHSACHALYIHCLTPFVLCSPGRVPHGPFAVHVLCRRRDFLRGDLSAAEHRGSPGGRGGVGGGVLGTRPGQAGAHGTGTRHDAGESGLGRDRHACTNGRMESGGRTSPHFCLHGSGHSVFRQETRHIDVVKVLIPVPHHTSRHWSSHLTWLPSSRAGLLHGAIVGG